MGLRHASIVVLIALSSAAPASHEVADFARAQRLDTGSTLARLRDYVLAWQQALTAVVAEEQFTQTLEQFPDGRAAASAGSKTTRRTLVSDVLLVRVPSESVWMLFRDVISVDGVPVRDRQRRFDELFARPDADIVATARRIADEGARYNLGMFRNVNTPTAALAFLDEEYRSSVRWRAPERVTVDGRSLLKLEFEQKRAPFTVHSPTGNPRPATGAIWIEPSSARVVRTVVEMRSTRRRMSDRGSRRAALAGTRMFARIAADFGPVPGVDPWVPLRMTDEYDVHARFDESLTAEATYTNHRLFQTDARIIGDE